MSPKVGMAKIRWSFDVEYNSSYSVLYELVQYLCSMLEVNFQFYKLVIILYDTQMVVTPRAGGRQGLITCGVVLIQSFLSFPFQQQMTRAWRGQKPLSPSNLRYRGQC